MTKLHSKLKIQFDRINKNSKNSKARLRAKKNGGFTVYLDMHNKGKRIYEATEFEISNNIDYYNQDSETLIKISMLLKDINKKMVEKNFNDTEDIPEKPIYILEYFKEIKDKNSENLCFYNIHRVVESFLTESKQLQITFKELDEKDENDRRKGIDFCRGFYDFIKNKESLNANSKRLYFQYFKLVLSRAVEAEHLTKNYILRSKEMKFDKEVTYPDYLTMQEISKIVKLEVNKFLVEIKQAFLFSCFTGLRSSDIRKLRFEDIRDNHIYIIQKKTKEALSLPISQDAYKIVEQQRLKYNNGRIFRLKTHLYMQMKAIFTKSELSQNRKLSFHSARHSFAMMLLDAGNPIQTISNALGHKSIETTMIYQRMKDKHLKEAIETLPTFL
jgi:integrase